MAEPSRIESERLLLRPWKDSDREPFASMGADPTVMEFFPALLDRAASDAMVDFCAWRIADQGWGLWAVERVATGDFLGFVGLQIPSRDLPFSPCVEVGWRLAREHWGFGYATEAARAALGFGFESLELEEIVSFTSVLNVRSRAVMERLGMLPDGTFPHPALPEGHRLREHCLYRMDRGRWAALREPG
ncbi:MAG: GNAT family N-acetyltransferase [Isosphaeraceae bacterium]